MKKTRSILSFGLVYLILFLSILVLMLFLRDGDKTVILILNFSAIILLLFGVFFFLIGVYYPLRRFRQKLKFLSRGEFLNFKSSASTSEMKEIEGYLQVHVDRLNEVVGVANNLAKGVYDKEFKAQDEKDELGRALQMLEESILVSAEEALERRKLDEQQNWASQGLAKFGELLRDFEHKVNILSNKFIKELVAYVEMEVGGLFLLTTDNEGEPVLELKGAYAFDREKQANQFFKFGEGLVGRCALEKSSIIISDVPKDYIKIRSGMGEDMPSSILLVPIVTDSQVIGVIELATFSAVPQYKIEFLEALGRSIASSLLKAISSGLKD